MPCPTAPSPTAPLSAVSGIGFPALAEGWRILTAPPPAPPPSAASDIGFTTLAVSWRRMLIDGRVVDLSLSEMLPGLVSVVIPLDGPHANQIREMDGMADDAERGALYEAVNVRNIIQRPTR